MKTSAKVGQNNYGTHHTSLDVLTETTREPLPRRVHDMLSPLSGSRTALVPVGGG